MSFDLMLSYMKEDASLVCTETVCVCTRILKETDGHRITSVNPLTFNTFNTPLEVISARKLARSNQT